MKKIEKMNECYLSLFISWIKNIKNHHHHHHFLKFGESVKPSLFLWIRLVTARLIPKVAIMIRRVLTARVLPICSRFIKLSHYCLKNMIYRLAILKISQIVKVLLSEIFFFQGSLWYKFKTTEIQWLTVRTKQIVLGLLFVVNPFTIVTQPLKLGAY